MRTMTGDNHTLFEEALFRMQRLNARFFLALGLDSECVDFATGSYVRSEGALSKDVVTRNISQGLLDDLSEEYVKLYDEFSCVFDSFE